MPHRHPTSLFSRFIAFIVILLMVWPGLALAESFLTRQSVQDYVRAISREHNLDQHRVAGLFARTKSLPRVLESISKPAEKVLTWEQYRPIFIKQARIDAGLAFMQEHEDLLNAAEERYGVPAEIVAAIIGVESYYGRFKGQYRVLESVATLAFDYPPRAKFFKRELTEFIVLAESEGWDALSVRGSYAGAMGFPQFISSSYRHYAIDMDGDGRRDLFNSPADVIGSVAHYLSRHGWQRGAPVALAVDAAAATSANLSALIKKSLKPAIAAATVREKGVAVKGDRNVSVMKFSGKTGEEFWVGYTNFYAITRYNHSALYALAVYQFSQELALRGV